MYFYLPYLYKTKRKVMINKNPNKTKIIGILGKPKKRKKNYLQCSGREFNPNGGLRLQAELISGKSREDVGFSNTRIPNEYDLEEIVVFMVHFVCHASNTRHHPKPACPRDPVANSRGSNAHRSVIITVIKNINP